MQQQSIQRISKGKRKLRNAGKSTEKVTEKQSDGSVQINPLCLKMFIEKGLQKQTSLVALYYKTIY